MVTGAVSECACALVPMRKLVRRCASCARALQVSRDAEGYGSVEHISSLSGHTRTVNCVRYSPSGVF